MCSSDLIDHLIQWGRIEYDPTTGLSGREQVLQRMRECDALAMVHGDDPMCHEYIPSKLYEYLWMQRPIVATAHGNPQMAQLIREQGHWVAEHPLQADSAVKIAPELARILCQLWQQWRTQGLPDTAQTTPYTTEASTRQLITWAQALYR